MKIIDLRTSPEEEKELAVKEANLLKELNHPNVLQYTDSFESDGALCIVTEFCSNGDLSEFLEKRKGKKLEEDQLREWFRQITCALQVCFRVSN
jgi:serine/threonine protein kinase